MSGESFEIQGYSGEEYNLSAITFEVGQKAEVFEQLQPLSDFLSVIRRKAIDEENPISERSAQTLLNELQVLQRIASSRDGIIAWVRKANTMSNFLRKLSALIGLAIAGLFAAEMIWKTTHDFREQLVGLRLPLTLTGSFAVSCFSMVSHKKMREEELVPLADPYVKVLNWISELPLPENDLGTKIRNQVEQFKQDLKIQ